MIALKVRSFSPLLPLAFIEDLYSLPQQLAKLKNKIIPVADACQVRACNPEIVLLCMIKKAAYIVSLFLLIFNGAGAVYGGWMLMTDPSGTDIQLSLTTLDHTPFPDFLISGIVLFVCMGLFSLLAVFSALLLQPNYSYFILAEGILLTSWIIIQYAWTQLYHPLQLTMGITGLLLVVCGCLLHKSEGENLCV